MGTQSMEDNVSQWRANVVHTIAIAIGIWICCTLSVSAQSQQVRVEITNNAPTGGVALTPVWVGFHSGSFDSYNGGLAAQPGLERIAEDGDTSLVSSQFLDFDATGGGYTYVAPGPANGLVRTGDLQDQFRVDGTLGSPTGPPPVQPGESVSQTFTLRTDGSNNYFSYLSMVLPSNDFFVANGNPFAHDLSSLFDGSGTISFNIGGFNASPVNDAGTEAESYVNSAANGLFGLAGGQATGDTPNGSLGLPITNVTGSLPLDSLNFVEGSQPLFDFNNGALYGNGIATVTITAVPEPNAAVLLSMAGLVIFATCRRRR